MVFEVLKVNYFPHQMAITLTEKGFLEKRPEKLNKKRQLLPNEVSITASEMFLLLPMPSSQEYDPPALEWHESSPRLSYRE
jgi:hypothetical protein